LNSEQQLPATTQPEELGSSGPNSGIRSAKMSLGKLLSRRLAVVVVVWLGGGGRTRIYRQKKGVQKPEYKKLNYEINTWKTKP